MEDASSLDMYIDDCTITLNLEAFDQFNGAELTIFGYFDIASARNRRIKMWKIVTIIILIIIKIDQIKFVHMY